MNIARHSVLQVRGAVLLLTQCALLLAACSSEEGAAETAPPAADIPDPCTLVTGADAGEALGAPISESDRPREANNEYLATCRYVAPRGAGVAVMTIMVHGQSGRAGFSSLREQPFDIEDVTGVGDDAFWMGEQVGTLYVLQGEVFFSIGGDVALGQAKSLAMKAIGRLR